MILIHKNQKTSICWWCGSPANSREHRHKKSDLKRVFKKGEEFDAVLSKKNKVTYLQAPNSDHVKFDKSLCHNCNTTRSQPFDQAYDKFISYFETNTEKIIQEGKIDYSQIFTHNILEEKQNVFRYYTKHLCCRLFSSGITISEPLIDFLNKEASLQHLYIKFEIRLDLKQWLQILATQYGEDVGNLYLGELTCFPSKNDNCELEWVYTYYNYRFFKSMFFYSDSINDQNYSWYTKYNTEEIVPIQSLYTVHPEKFKDSSAKEFLAEYDKQRSKYDIADLINDSFSTDPFYLLNS